MSMIIREARLSDIDDLVDTVRQDSHSVVRPTHIVEKNGLTIGYISVAALPVFGVWMHTQRAKARDSLRVEQFCEQTAKAGGLNLICMPCSVTSPFHPYMERLGFTSFGRMDMFIKSL